MNRMRSLLCVVACCVLGCRQGETSTQAAVAGLAVPATGLRGGHGDPDSACGDLGVNFGSHKCKVQLSTGITMAYLETGPKNGPAVILIHGLTDSIRSWSLSMRALHARNPELHILAIDQRGHGATSMPPGEDCPGAPEDCFRTNGSRRWWRRWSA